MIRAMLEEWNIGEEKFQLEPNNNLMIEEDNRAVSVHAKRTKKKIPEKEIIEVKK